MPNNEITAMDLLREAMEALEPKHHSNNHRRDTIECGGCSGWVHVANPPHPHASRCNEFCEGTHEQREIEHASYCTYEKIRKYLAAAE